jgi:hypothetical protein
MSAKDPVFPDLAIVVFDGYKPDVPTVELEDGTVMENPYGPIDLPGSANWLCERYGMQGESFDPEADGILWTDYDFGMDGDGWRFSVLIDATEIEASIRSTNP